MECRGGWGGWVWIVDLVDLLGRAKAGGSQAGVSQVLVEVQKLAIRTRFSHKASSTGQFGVVEPRMNQSPSLSGARY